MESDADLLGDPVISEPTPQEEVRLDSPKVQVGFCPVTGKPVYL